MSVTAESLVSVTDEASVDVDFDRSRRVEVQTCAPWLSAELGDDGRLRLRVTGERVPDGEHAGIVRLAYADGAAAASVMWRSSEPPRAGGDDPALVAAAVA